MICTKTVCTVLAYNHTLAIYFRQVTLLGLLHTVPSIPTANTLHNNKEEFRYALIILRASLALMIIDSE